MGKRYDPDAVVHSFYTEGQVLVVMVLPLPVGPPPPTNLSTDDLHKVTDEV